MLAVSLSASPGWASTPAQPIWVNTYNGPDGLNDTPRRMAVDPTTGNVYVTGSSFGASTGYDYATVAYDAAGTRLWDARYNGPADDDDGPNGLVVDATTGNVYVTGHSRGLTSGLDYATVAYSRAGTQLWVARYDGLASGDDVANAAALDPGTGTVYVTGVTAARPGGADFATLAYSVAGALLGVARYDGPSEQYDEAKAIAVNPDTGNVYVAGISTTATGGADYLTLAYSRTGRRLWVALYNSPATSAEFLNALAVDPGTGNVYITGSSPGETTSYDYATVAYAEKGTQLWVNRYSGVGNGFESASALAVDSGTGNVYVTGSVQREATDFDYATIAYSSGGATLWSDLYNGPANGSDGAKAVAVDPSSGNVYVTGGSPGRGLHDFATVAYDGTGSRLGVARYVNPGQRASGAVSIGVDPGLGNVYVTGSTMAAPGTGRLDYTVVAYPTP